MVALIHRKGNLTAKFIPGGAGPFPFAGIVPAFGNIAEPLHKFDIERAVYAQIFRMILERGVDPNLVGRFGYRLAHHLAACGIVWNEPIMSEAERVEFATILLDHGADLDVVDELLQSSPLGWAARWGKYDLARLYLERGADPTLAGESWATPLAWAEKKGYTDIADLIKRYL